MAQPNNLAGAIAPTYNTYYANPSNDDYQGNYEDVMNLFATTINPEDADKKDQLRATVFTTCERQIHAYLILTQTVNGDPFVQLIHRPSLFVPRMGSAEQPQSLALMGDVRNGVYPRLVAWPARAFEQTDPFNVPTYEAIDTIYAADPNVALVGPFAEDQAGITAIRTRKLMYLPPKYIHLVLERHLTPRQAWEIIGGAVRQEPQQVQQHLKPILDWLTGACTKFANTDVPIVRLPPPPAPVPYTTGLQDHHSDLVNRDLPNLQLPGNNDPAAATQPVVDAVNNLAAELVRTRNEEAVRRAADKTKTPSDYFGDNIITLLRYTHAPDAVQLPPLYTTIANTTKKNLRPVIAEKLRGIAHDLGKEYYTPLVTPDIATRIAAVSFYHADKDDLTGGMQPFMTPPLTTQEQSELTQNIAAYDTIVGGTAAQLSDLTKLQSAHKVRLPKSILQAGHQLNSFGILLRAILGPAHSFYLAYNEFVTQFNSQQTLLEIQTTSFEYPAQIVRWVQLRVSNWFNRQQLTPARVPPPRFMELFECIENEEHWKPRLPGTSTTNPGAGPPRPAAPPPTRTRISNDGYDVAYQAYKDGNITMAQARDHARTNNAPIPKNAQGTEMCLSYHVLGFCWSNCARAADHQKQRPTDKTKLKAWCDEHYV